MVVTASARTNLPTGRSLRQARRNRRQPVHQSPRCREQRCHGHLCKKEEPTATNQAGRLLGGPASTATPKLILKKFRSSKSSDPHLRFLDPASRSILHRKTSLRSRVLTRSFDANCAGAKECGVSKCRNAKSKEAARQPGLWQKSARPRDWEKCASYCSQCEQ